MKFNRFDRANVVAKSYEAGVSTGLAMNSLATKLKDAKNAVAKTLVGEACGAFVAGAKDAMAKPEHHREIRRQVAEEAAREHNEQAFQPV